MAAATRVWMAFAISILALSVSGAAGAQVFAAVRDELTRNPTGRDNQVVSAIRMAFTGGWIVGPVLGSVLGSLIGLRWLLVVAAVCIALQAVPLLGQRVPRLDVPPAGDGPVLRRDSLRTALPMLIFIALCVLAISGDTVKFAYLPIYLEHTLHASDAVRGAVIAIQPLFELLLMPVFAWAADRVGAARLVAVGMGFGVLANVGYALSTSVLELFGAQVLMAGMWAAIAGLGVTVAQALYPQGVGLASTAFFSSIVFSSALGGLIGTAGVVLLGVPRLFLLPAGLCALAAGGMIIMVLRTRARTI
jgi:SET family sugar efflux transporter-like MFS transporter